MAYADKIFKQNLELLLKGDAHSDAKYKVRPKWEDGTPAHTIYATAISNVYDINENGIPITTLRPVAWKSALKEILWIWQDKSNDVNVLKEKYNVHYWDSWANEDGNLGMAYGATAAKKYDFPDTPEPMTQLDRVIYLLRNDPMNRAIMTNLIEFENLGNYTLRPCAYETLWSVRGEFLDMSLVQRSNDMIAAQSINALQYSFLLCMVAQMVGLKPGKMTHFIQNMHIYDRHLSIAKELLERPESYQPAFHLEQPEDGIYKPEHFIITGYFPGEPVGKIPIAI